MRKTTLTIITLFSTLLLLSSCGGKAKKAEGEGQKEELVVENDEAIDFAEIHFDNNWNKPYKSKDKLSREEYDKLRLSELSFLGNYGDLDYQIGDILIDSKNKKLLTVKAIASGEISEYLLGYIGNEFTDSLLLAYEDNVEYFSLTSSIIKQNQIEVMTINWDYSGQEEVSDTIVSKYNITPALNFEEIIEEQI